MGHTLGPVLIRGFHCRQNEHSTSTVHNKWPLCNQNSNLLRKQFTQRLTKHKDLLILSSVHKLFLVHHKHRRGLEAMYGMAFPSTSASWRVPPDWVCWLTKNHREKPKPLKFTNSLRCCNLCSADSGTHHHSNRIFTSKEPWSAILSKLQIWHLRRCH